MKTSHITLLALAAAAVASCAPYPPLLPTSGNSTATAAATSNAEVPAPTVEGQTGVPLAKPSPDGKKNTVISPYSPYNLIDVTGYSSGEIVGDPSTATVNPSTGKLDLSTAKHFRLP